MGRDQRDGKMEREMEGKLAEKDVVGEPRAGGSNHAGSEVGKGKFERRGVVTRDLLLLFRGV